jgi:spermidine/putrescine-binding protein|tara:strand:- start:437 stop:766 length:330 start_codon:yes stop_codon:yes gene_type:complete
MPSSDNNDPKTKEELWQEIYGNATQDREKASMLITNLWKEITADPEKHVLYGTTVTKYLERMSKSNDQLVKLAELMSKNEDFDDSPPDLNDVYDRIEVKEKIKIKVEDD